jgi:hypothetical protein
MYVGELESLGLSISLQLGLHQLTIACSVGGNIYSNFTIGSSQGPAIHIKVDLSLC